MSPLILLVAIGAAILALGYAAINFFSVKKLDEGTDRMKEIASAIRIGANAFLSYEKRIIIIVGLVVAVIIAFLVSWQAAIAFLIGATMSECAGYVGMKIATSSNARTAQAAPENRARSAMRRQESAASN